ncbi:hypothetical protein ACLI09_14630 [Flavobacterium sp. RHBU_24]|uniref:hypothetical protein n=1 Tax=Flavobacterium sp. RHBU_24 TaxID=3391185 RepID=UPI003984B7B6
MKTKSLLFICTFIVSLSGCNRKEKPVIIKPLNTEGNVTMVTNDDVTERSYKFSDIPLTFMFSDSTASYVLYGSTRKEVSDIFYSREMAEKNAPNLAAHYTIDRNSFINEPDRNTLMEADQITAGNNKYVLCSFDKQRFSIGPLNHYYYYLIDITNEDDIAAIAFTSLAEEGEYMPKIYSKNGRICVDLTYYSHLKAGDYTTETTVVTQDGNGNWVME